MPPADRSGFEGQASEHFAFSEFRCRCGRCSGYPANRQVIVNTAAFLEKIREILGGRSIRINSGYRCARHNRAVGGASDSQHVRGYAVDIVVEGLTPYQVQTKLRPHLGTLIGGMGRYSSFTHLDRRTNGPALWNG